MTVSTTIISLLILYAVTHLYDKGRRIQHELPSLRFEGVWTSYVVSIVNCFCTKFAIEEACKKYGDRLFAFPLVGQWVVLARSKEHIREICNAPEDVLSMEAAAEELLQLRYTIGPEFCNETYHIPAIRTSLNQNLSVILPELVDEIISSFKEIDEKAMKRWTLSTKLVSRFRRRGRKDIEWVPLDGLSTVSRIVCRASTRVFVGTSMARNEEYCRLASKFTNDTLNAGPIIKFLIPKFLRPMTGFVYRAFYGHHRRMLALLQPVIEQRRMAMSASTTRPSNDMLSWLMATAEPLRPHSNESLAMRMLNVNFVALHTTTKTLTHAIYHLASQPQYIPILREEVERYLGADPTEWNIGKLGRCVKMDSFFKETLRLNGLGAIWMPRLAMTDFTFVDGTKVTSGNFLATAAAVVHEDNNIYDRPRTFDGLRFCNLRSSKENAFDEGSDDWMFRSTGTSESYLSFGGGRHICPGRFFTSMEMKCIMAYLVLHYDVRMPQAGVRPPDEWYGPTSNPARNVMVLFKRRELLLPDAVNVCIYDATSYRLCYPRFSQFVYIES
ncbi:cytochrome P450 [Dendrothele bispora CBS 962.96]|uniref:Cytochrome P450 n=1 Tax=Dendrothele bispora (strain CBS 962.96) TaxID=1314807 RepID=A0A4S8KKQ2_DENBC|nr:cytochrome P450 [Dendrothele bispora CBS 962.96]